MPQPPAATSRSSPTQRLLVCAHGLTEDLRLARFGGSAPLSRPDLALPVAEPVTRWVCGPEPACRETLARWGVDPVPLPELAGPHFGTWDGRALDEVARADPEGLAAWIHDPAHAPPGGEHLSALVDRLRPFAADVQTAGWSGVVTTPLVARALVVAALDAGADLVGRIEVGPGGRAVLTRPGVHARWRLRELT